MKILAGFLGLLAVIVGGIYFIAFTPTGNSILQPIIQTKINEGKDLNAKLTTFKLDISKLELFLELDSQNSIHVQGDYSLLAQSFDLIYKVKLEKLENLESLTNKPLKGSFNTNGTIKGNMAFMNIDGVSDIALSDTTYHIELTELNPTSIIAKVNNADLASLLELGGQKPYAKAKLDVDVNFKDITPNKLDGNIVLVTKNGKLNTTLMNKDFELNIPKTNFTMNLDAKLKGEKVNYAYELNSNLAKITSAGKLIPAPLKVDSKYFIDVKELAVLKPITNADIRGPVKLSGDIKGTKESMTVNGISDLAASDTVFILVLKELKASSLKANIKNLKLDKVLYTLKQPHYADGVVDLEVNISDLRKGKLKGTVISNVKNGLVDSKFMTKQNKFKTKMPKTKFTLTTYTSLAGDIVDSKVDLESTLANVEIKKAKYNLKDKSIQSDYKATIPSLDKLYFVIERHLKGSLIANGEYKKDKDENVDITMHTKIAGGNVDMKIHNDDLIADIKSMQTLELMSMLQYPPVFKSSLNGKLNYNTAKKKGQFKGNLLDGGFEQNMVFSLVRQYANINMYKQKFKGDVSADINKGKVLASFDLRSNTSSIKTVNTKINSDTNQINSKIDIVANNHPVSVTLIGDKSKPKVKVDTERIIKEQLKKEVDKKIGDFLQKLF